MVRPSGLTDKAGGAKGKYLATLESGAGMGQIHKEDVGLALMDMVESGEWDNKKVQLYPAK